MSRFDRFLDAFFRAFFWAWIVFGLSVGVVAVFQRVVHGQQADRAYRVPGQIPDTYQLLRQLKDDVDQLRLQVQRSCAPTPEAP